MPENDGMPIQILDDLATVDEMARRFAPYGLAVGGLMSPEDTVRWHQTTIAGIDLTEGVPRDVKASFERLRDTHTYGVLRFGLFSVAHSQSYMVIDHALRSRFISYYENLIPLVNLETKERKKVRVSGFESLYQLLRKEYKVGKGWRLEIEEGEARTFHGSFTNLLDWAFSVGLLRGQRSRRISEVIEKLRNLSVHLSSPSTVSPVDSARAIWDTGEIINQLWGQPTPGGRLFPAPIERRVMVIGWTEDGTSVSFEAERWRQHLVDRDERWTFIVVRAVRDDPWLHQFHSRFERTAYPAELLSGPGTPKEIAGWLAGDPALDVDHFDYLDRLFLIRVADSGPELPRRPEIAMTLSEDELHGTWYLIRADRPTAALRHVRGPGGNRDDSCVERGFCSTCAVVSAGRRAVGSGARAPPRHRARAGSERGRSVALGQSPRVRDPRRRWIVRRANAPRTSLDHSWWPFWPPGWIRRRSPGCCEWEGAPSVTRHLCPRN